MKHFWRSLVMAFKQDHQKSWSKITNNHEKCFIWGLIMTNHGSQRHILDLVWNLSALDVRYIPECGILILLGPWSWGARLDSIPPSYRNMNNIAPPMGDLLRIDRGVRSQSHKVKCFIRGGLSKSKLSPPSSFMHISNKCACHECAWGRQG